MPTYDYKCDKCGNEETHTHSIFETYCANCLECGNEMRKLYRSPATTFTGEGFYTTDKNK